MRALAALALLASAAANAAEMIDLRYQDSEADGASYETRILVTERYLRMDGGRDDGDFVLFVRKTGKIVNVMHVRKMLMVMNKGKLPKTPPQPYKPKARVLKFLSLISGT